MKKTSALLTLFSFVAAAAFAADRPAASPKDVVVFDHTKMDETFAKGGPLELNAHYKIMAGRRVEPGKVEIHDHDTDIFYITEGSATFVTGGKAVGVKDTKPGEKLGESITGGTTRKLTKGDVIVIPAGIPHQYTEVSGTFLYFVVKVTEK